MFLVNLLDNGYAILGTTNGADTVLTIPAEIDHVPVRSIAPYAFAGNQSVQEVWLPDSLKMIGAGAFRGCRRLKKVFVSGTPDCPVPLDNFTLSVFPDKIVIKENAFERTALEVIRFGCQATIGRSSFADTHALLCVHFPPAGGCRMEEGAFANSGLSQIILPDHMAVIPARAFIDSDVSLVRFPAHLVSIGTEAFAVTRKNHRGHLRSARLCNGVKNIGERVFCGQRMLQRVDLPADVESIAASAFSGCGALDGISITGQIPADERRYFTENHTLYEILESGGTSIVRAPARMWNGRFRDDTVRVGAYAFADTHITYADIPDSVESIEAHAFENTRFLTEITIEDMPFVGHHAFYGCSSLSKVTIGHLDSALDIEDVFGSTVPQEFVLVEITPEQAQCDIFPNGTPNASITLFYGGKYHPYHPRGRKAELLNFAAEEFEGHIELTQYTGEMEDVVIPANTLFKPVTVLRKSTFEGSAGRIHSLVIPPSIRVEHGALELLENLEEITLPRSAVKEIFPLVEHGCLSQIVIAE